MDATLVSMPWAIFNRPSIQLGALQAYLQQQGHSVGCRHPYLEVAATVGLDNYRKIAENPWAAEALYCALLFPEREKQAQQVFKNAMRGKQVISFANLLPLLKKQMEHWLDSLDIGDSLLIGFSVCFSQLPASLFAARAIKKKWPQVTIVFGGSTCTKALGSSLLNIFTEIEYIITGEGELPLAHLLEHLKQNTHPDHPSLVSRSPALPTSTAGSAAVEIEDLSLLPLPDYHDYFQQMKTAGLDFIPALPLEFSRGCWWNKCSFCNLNLQWQGYRFKRSQQVTDEVGTMTATYQCLDFTFTDNALPVKEADLFFAAMAAGDMDLNFFAEIRTLRKPETYAAYRRGGLNSVQVGIESLSDTLLTRMRKGTTVMENVAAMKFSQAAGMVLDGNLILEFPGSTDREVQETLQVLDKVLPFRPLTAAGFFLGHGSPVCCAPWEYGITSLLQHPTYAKLYPAKILARLDMLIKSYRGDRTIQKKRWQAVRSKIEQWQTFHCKRPDPSLPPLSYRDGGTFLIIRQERPGTPPLHHRLRGLSRKIYLACDQPVRKKKLLSRFSQVTKEQLSAFLADLEQKHIVFCDDRSCLALAVRAHD
jgi:ribosomal peptide maturation radical SAM protein 1